MKKRKIIKHKLKGFTIAEILIVLILTSISITLSYGTLTYIQKIFSEYKKQNKFLNEFTDLKRRMDFESLKASRVVEQQENTFEITRDSSLVTLQIEEGIILMKKKEVCDTFHITAKNIKKEYEAMTNPEWTNRLLSSLEFDTDFSKQTFHFYFSKEHSASLKLELEKIN